MKSSYEFTNAKGIVQLVAPTENMLLVALTIEAIARPLSNHRGSRAINVTWSANKVYRKEDVTEEKYQQLIRGFEVDVSSIPLENLDWKINDSVIKDLTISDGFIAAGTQKFGSL